MKGRRLEESLEVARRTERHLEAIAENVLTKETMSHFMKAGAEFIQGLNAAAQKMEIPQETKNKIHSAEREVLLASKSFIDAVLTEIEKEMPAKSSKKADLKKIEVRKKTK